MNTCFFCGVSENETKGGLVEEAYYNSHAKLEQIVLGCRDINSCLDRQIDSGRLPSYMKRSWEVKTE